MSDTDPRLQLLDFSETGITSGVAMRFGMPGTPTELNPTSQVKEYV